MRTRNQELRERHRKILGWSVAAAALLHVAVFWLMPTFVATPIGSQGDRESEGATFVSVVPTYVEVRFGPPTIRTPDGGDWTEPPERFLMAARLVRLTDECRRIERELDGPVEGSVRLWVNDGGRAEALELTRSTGNDCADEVLMIVADDLWYQWLPTDQFPAPIDMVQPVTLEVARP